MKTTAIFKMDFTKTNECYIGFTRDFDTIIDQFEAHIKDGKADRTRAHDLMEEFGKEYFVATILEAFPTGTRYEDEVVKKAKAKYIRDYKPTLNSFKDRQLSYPPIEEVKDLLLLLTSKVEELMGGSETSSMIELLEDIVKQNKWIKEQNEVITTYVKQIFDNQTKAKQR